jgi:hypothetical protein
MVTQRSLVAFLRDSSGAALLETVIVLNVLMLVLVAFIELGTAVNQWNLAAKAAQIGARLAATSDPVDSTLSAWTGLETDPPGQPITGGYDRDCRGDTAECTGGTFDLDALKRIVYGSDPQSCDGSPPTIGMCDVLASITPENVRIRYQFSGLGYSGRPGGPVPTITVSLTGMTVQFLLLGSFLGLDDLALPSFPVTIVGEDLSTSYDPE